MKNKYNQLFILIILLGIISCYDPTQTIEKENFIIKIPDDIKEIENLVSLNKEIRIWTKDAEMIYGRKYNFYIIVLQDDKVELDKEYTIKNFINEKIDTLWKANRYLNAYEEVINEKPAFISEISTRDSSGGMGFVGRNVFWRIAVLESDNSFFTILTYESALQHGYFKNEETRNAIRSFI